MRSRSTTVRSTVSRWAEEAAAGACTIGRFGINQPGQFRGNGRTQNMIQSVGCRRIADEPVPCFQGQLGSLDLDMGPFGSIRVKRLQIEAGQNVEQQQGHGALPVRRMLDDRELSVLSLDGLAIVGRAVCKILQSVLAASLPQAFPPYPRRPHPGRMPIDRAGRSA